MKSGYILNTKTDYPVEDIRHGKAVVDLFHPNGRKMREILFDSQADAEQALKFWKENEEILRMIDRAIVLLCDPNKA